MQLNCALAHTVRELRLKNGLSQEKLADEIDSHQVYISEIEQGKKIPSLQILYKMAQSFKIPLSEMIKIVESKLD